MAYGSKEMVTYATDGHLTVWKYDSSNPVCQTKLDTLTHSLQLYNKTIITASSANKVSTHTLNRYEVTLIRITMLSFFFTILSHFLPLGVLVKVPCMGHVNNISSSQGYHGGTLPRFLRLL